MSHSCQLPECGDIEGSEKQSENIEKENATFHCSGTISQTLGRIRIMLNLLLQD